MKSRPVRWQEACDKIREGLDELTEIRDEYQDWMDNLPENLQSGALHEKLEAVCDIDLDSIDSALSDAEGAALPLGFGRD